MPKTADKLSERIKRDECYTPDLIVSRARHVMRAIDLDPASSALANTMVRATKIFTFADNGLVQQWRGRVWLNPPYSRPAPWVDKLIDSYLLDGVTEACALFNNRSSSAWFRALDSLAWRCELKRRVRFWGPSTGRFTTGMQDQVVFYLGSSHNAFASAFQDVGRIVSPAAVTTGVTLGRRQCMVCRRPLDGLRQDADVCSGRCRTRRYRQQLTLGRSRPASPARER